MRGKKMALITLVLCVVCLSPSCRTVSPAPSPSPSPGQTVLATEAEAEARALLLKAQEAMDNTHLSEAIRAFVAVLALQQANPGSEGLTTSAATAKAELTRISTRLSIEPVEAWMDDQGKQITGTTRSIGSPSALMPMVYLYENFGAGKSPVQDAPIAFEFVKNSGTLTAIVTTDSFGRANTNLSKLDKPGEVAIIRASPLFRSRGFAYPFSGVFRDFTYEPPIKTIAAIGMAKREDAGSAPEFSMDPFAPSLKELGFRVLPGAASATSADFNAAFDGLPGAAERLCVQRGSGFLALGKVEIYSVSQAEYDGVKYGQWFAYAKAMLRIVGSDGTVVSTIQVDGVKGGHGTPERAVEAAYKLAVESLVKKVETSLPSLREAFQKL